MKRTASTPTATSLPEAPLSDAQARTRRYLYMMGIRLVCFVLMALITPYGWYTWVLAAGAVFLPYFAVVLANVTSSTQVGSAESPYAALPASSTVEPAPQQPVIQVQESPTVDDDAAH